MSFYLATIIIVVLLISLTPTVQALRTAIEDRNDIERSNIDGTFELLGEHSFLRESARTIKHILISVSLGTSLLLPESAGLIMFRNINAAIIVGICTIDSIVTIRFRKKFRRDRLKLKQQIEATGWNPTEK